MKIFRKLLTIILLINLAFQKCLSIDETFFGENKQIPSKLDQWKQLTPEQCENWYLDDFGVPCQYIWTPITTNFSPDQPLNMKDLFFLFPTNLDHYSQKNQQLAVQVLSKLKLYPQEADLNNEDEIDVDDMESFKNEEGELVPLPVIKHDLLSDRCFTITTDTSKFLNNQDLPFVKNLHANFDKSQIPNSQSLRFFHHTYSMVSIKTLWDRNQYTFDSIMKPLDGKPVNDFLLLKNFRNSMVILNYIFSIIKNLAGIAPFPEGTCKDIGAFNKAYLPARRKQLLFWIDELKDQMYEHTNQSNSKTSAFIEKRVNQEFGIVDFEKPKQKQQQDEDIVISEPDIKIEIPKKQDKKLQMDKKKRTVRRSNSAPVGKSQIKKRILKEDKITCEQYFKKNPVFIPDISVQDFVFTINPKLKASDPNADEKNTSTFKNIPIERLIESITLSSYTYPEFINESEKFEKIYAQDEMLKILKLHDADLSPSKHRYFYVLAQFYKLFQEFFDRYVINKVVFYNCFAIEDYSKPNLYCPQFLKDLLNILEEQEKVSMHKLVSLDLHYIYENPKLLVLTINKFLLKSLEYSEAFTDQKIKIFDQKGNVIQNSLIDYESLNNDFSSSAFHQKIVDSIVPAVQEISKVSLRKSEYYMKLVDALRKFGFDGCASDVDPEFMDQPLNQNFAIVMMKFVEGFDDKLPSEAMDAIKKICVAVKDRKQVDILEATNEFENLKRIMQDFKIKGDVSLLKIEKEVLKICDTPLCIQTRKQEALKKNQDRLREEAQKLKEENTIKLIQLFYQNVLIFIDLNNQEFLAQIYLNQLLQTSNVRKPRLFRPFETYFHQAQLYKHQK